MTVFGNFIMLQINSKSPLALMTHAYVSIEYLANLYSPCSKRFELERFCFKLQL